MFSDDEPRRKITAHEVGMPLDSLSIEELQERIGLSQSSLSQHLARLRGDGLVTTRRQSQTIYYSLAHHHVTELIGLMHEIYCREPA